MGVRQLLWRACYEALAARVRQPEWAFMNYGFAPLEEGGVAVALEPRDEPDRLCIQLYRHVVTAKARHEDSAHGDAVQDVGAQRGGELRGRDVLEVGSGRGGGSQYLSPYHGPGSVTGLDFSRRAVALSRRHRGAPGLRFVHGNAEAMPFAANSFDVVVNVESSHCYASIDGFLGEVCRVLRPGGDFYWADLRDRDGAVAVRRQFDASGLAVCCSQDITANVRRAMELDNTRKEDLISAWIPRGFHRAIRPFAGVVGTPNYDRLGSGDLRYLSAHLVKP